MMEPALLAELIAYCGIETEYHDAWGQQTQVPEEQQLALLAAQGFDIENEALAREQLLERRAHFWQQLLAPVSVQLQQQPVVVELQLPLTLANEPLSLQLICEDGHQQTTELVAVDGELQQVILLDDTEYHQYQLVTDWLLPAGYHHLSVLCPVSGRKFEQRLIITPGQCFQPVQFGQKKQWGSAVQLYSLRSERNWGIGDFTDLKNLTGYLAEHGADFIGLNPVHALYPAMPESASPYSPSSRRWLNIIYIDVETMPGFSRCSEVQNQLVSAEIQQQLAALRQTDWVDYQGVMQQKLPVMKQLYHYVMQHPQHFTEELQQFEAFKAAGGQSLQQLALYDALHAWLLERDSRNWGWPVWPEDYRQPDSEAVTLFAREYQEQLDCYCYLQFIANRQLEAVQQYAKKQGMLLGLYRDLAVGVSEASTEIWGNPELYCRQASVGAPPDPLGPTGQNWGLPPMYPYQLFQQGYQPMIDLFRSNMQHAGALRIDHVMALLRLWWIPKSAENAGGGAYLYYPVVDLLGILALESQRQQVVVIGEDLGTVPDGIRELLLQFGIYSYRVFFFETAEDGGYISPAHYPLQAMATLTTHDLPTLIGFWHCEDLQLGQQLGLYKDETVLQQLYQQRHQNKQRILDSLHGHGMLPADFPRSTEHLGMSRTLSEALQCHLAAGSSQLLCLQPEDWLEMTQPVNVPGTSSEYPNWRRKLSLPLEQWSEQQHINALLDKLTQLRARNSVAG